MLLFQLENAQGERFGDSMIAIIDISIPMEESLIIENGTFQSEKLKSSILVNPKELKMSTQNVDDYIYQVAS